MDTDGSEHPSRLTVGRWRVLPNEGFIEHAGERRPLRLKSMEVLLLLASRPGATVTRAEFLQTIWGDRYVEEANLTRCIAEVRAALGDDARAPQYVETVPRRGYRLIAPTGEHATARVRRPRRRLVVGLVALLLAGGLLTGGWQLLSSSGAPPPGSESAPLRNPRMRIAILPVADLGNRGEDRIRPALERMLAAELASGSRSVVVPVEWVRRTAKELSIPSAALTEPASIRRLAAALDVTYLLAPSFWVQPEPGDEDLRFDMLVLDAQTGLATHGIVEVGSSNDLASVVSAVGRRLRNELALDEDPPAPVTPP
jgi:DNA-binding winged helix-turn-helix (wHTH) protein